jgi:hypothetical protein
MGAGLGPEDDTTRKCQPWSNLITIGSPKAERLAGISDTTDKKTPRDKDLAIAAMIAVSLSVR